MDLPYPSQHDVQISARISKTGTKPQRSCKNHGSAKSIQQQSEMTQKDKLKIIRLVQEDNVHRLANYLVKQAISFYGEVGKKDSLQNILHCCAKHNAAECATYILRTEYQQFPDSYESFVNSRTADGNTPAMIAALNFSHNFLEILLHYGGIDIHKINNNKLTTYQIAVNAQNERAVKLLMGYENKSKKSQIINKTRLSEPVDIVIEEQSVPMWIFSCLIECLTCGSYSGDSGKKQDKVTKKMTSILTMDSCIVDYVQIPSSSKDIGDAIIDWRAASQVITNQQPVLFDTFSPFDILQKNEKLRNMLIILQSVSQHPWLLRKIIQIDRSKTNYYNVALRVKGHQQIIPIDNHIPFLADKNEPAFTSDAKQMWPMLLEKALAKAYGSYYSLQKQSPAQLIESITGWTTKIQPMDQLDDGIGYLQKLTEKGYVFVLQGKKGSYLTDTQGNVHCFTVLNFYSKGDKKLVLVNCPFVEETWLQKEKHEMLALKLIKSHYSSTTQMCTWIQEERLKDYFSNVIISTILPNYERNTIHFKAKRSIFFKFLVDHEREEPILFQLFSEGTNSILDMRTLKGFINDGNCNLILMKPNLCMEEYAHIGNECGQYLCRIDTNSSSQSKYSLTSWSHDSICPEFIEENFAILDWLNCYKSMAIKTWKDEKYKVEEAENTSLVLFKRVPNTNKSYMSLEMARELILEGIWCEGGVQMIPCKEFAYCVVKAQLKDKRLAFYSE